MYHDTGAMIQYIAIYCNTVSKGMYCEFLKSDFRNTVMKN